MRFLLKFSDQMIGLVHTAILVIVLCGWAFPETRPLHQGALFIVGTSWFGLGLFKGIGYCALTDLQRRIKLKLGESLGGPTFIASLFLKAGIEVTPLFVNILAYGFYFVSLGIGIGQWFEVF